jgi:hypothetical protein
VKAVVVYESLWGNTAAVAAAIAEGIGEGASARPTSEVSAEDLRDADLLVAGAPLLGFQLPTDGMRASIASNPQHKDHPPSLSQPSMRDWLAGVPSRSAACASFETGLKWSPGSAAKRIRKTLAASGWQPAAPPERFLVEGTYGPLREGELARAREWGAGLARAVVG